MTFEQGQRVVRKTDTRGPGTIIYMPGAGLAHVHWDTGIAYECNESDLTPYVDAEPRKELPTAVITTGDTVRHNASFRTGKILDFVGTLTADGPVHDMRVQIQWDRPRGRRTIEPLSALTITHSTTQLQKASTMAKNLNKPQPIKVVTPQNVAPFPVHSMVKSILDPYRGLSGTVTSHLRDDGTTIVRWNISEQETRQATASLYYSTDRQQPEQVLIPAAAVSYQARQWEDEAITYRLPDVTLTETEANNKGTYYYSNEHTPGTGVHESVTAAYCLEVAATWAAIAHRITTRQAERDTAEREQLEAEAFTLYKASCEATDTTPAGSWAQAIDRDGETYPEGGTINVEDDFRAIALAARKLYGATK